MDRIEPEEVIAARDAYQRTLGQALTQYARTLPDPPADVRVIDLFAHAQTIRGDESTAATITRTVLDLGWRPM